MMEIFISVNNLKNFKLIYLREKFIPGQDLNHRSPAQTRVKSRKRERFGSGLCYLSVRAPDLKLETFGSKRGQDTNFPLRYINLIPSCSYA